MKVAITLALLVIIGCAWGIKEDETRREDREHISSHREENVPRHELSREREERLKEDRSERREDVGKKDTSRKSEDVSSKKGFKLPEHVKEQLVHEKSEKTHRTFINTMLEYVLNDENRDYERKCFDKFKSDETIDFVIDIAPSPSEDKVDKVCAESPIAFFMDVRRETPSQAYFNMVQAFIDAVTWDMKPECTQSIIYDNKNKFFICGKEIEASTKKSLMTEGGDFSDSSRNLKTMWPVANKEVVSAFGEKQTKKVEEVFKNNLGRMTKLALWNRNNGLPTVLGAKRKSKPVYTIVISDGSSGANIKDLTDDLTRTTVIDIGNRRFAKNLDWTEMRRLVNVITLNAPQQLVKLIDTCRLLIAKSYGC